MKKKLLICLIIICVLFLNGCGVRNKIKSWVNGESEAQADKIANTIAKAIEEKDADAIKKIMAKDALLDIDDIDLQIEYIFENIEGSITEIESDGNAKLVSGGGETGYCGQPTHKEIRGSYSFIAGEEKFQIIFIDNFQGTTKENTGLYAMKIMPYRDYDNGLSNLLNADDFDGIDLIEIDDLKVAYDKLQEKGEEPFERIVSRMIAKLQFSPDSGDSFTDNVSKKDTEKIQELLPYKIKSKNIEFEEKGFDINDVEMYVSAVVDIEDENSTHQMLKLIWVKDDDNQKTGMTYFAIMPKEKYDSGEKFPEGEGIFIIE